MAQFNVLVELPAALHALTKLQAIGITGNPLTLPPMEVRGRSELAAHEPDACLAAADAQVALGGTECVLQFLRLVHDGTGARAAAKLIPAPSSPAPP